MVALTKIKKTALTRVGVFLALSVIVANTILSPIVLAAGAVDSMTLDKQVNAYTYYYAWAKCMDNTDKWDGGHTWISIDDAASGKWFSTATGLGEEDGHVGYVASPSTGIMDCNGTDIVTNALSTWGFSSDKTAILTDQGSTGFHFTKKGDRYEPSDKYRSAFLSAIRNKAFGGQTPMLSSAAKYYFYSQSFIDKCQPSFIASPSADIKSAADSGSSNKYGMLKSYDPATKTMTDTYFELKSDPKMDTTIGNLVEGTSEVANVLGGAYGDGKAACKTLVSDANSNAPAFQLYAKQHPDLVPGDIKTGEGAASGNSDGGASTCVLEGVGWIVCPVVRTIASMIDKIYGLIQLMLTTPALPMEPNESTNPLYGAWSGMRNVANVVFVIAFLVVIYSQVTSAGMSNYGVKKLLPKLIVSAILINISFWVCALAVDVSNVLGASIYSFLSSIGGGGGNGSWTAVIELLLGGAAAGALTYGAITIAASALGAGGLGMALLWLAIPLVITIAIAILIGATVLALRQALIIILIFASPLAFAAYLLPNTQEWFDRWRKLFTTMLVFYPLFSILFGGASIASRVLVSSASKAPAGTAGVLLLIGMAVQFLPLFLVPFLIKTSSGLLGKFAGRMQGGLGGATGSLTKMARGRTAENMALAKGRLLTGNRQTNSRFGRRTFGAASGLTKKFDTDTRTRKLEQSRLESNRESDWQEQLATDPHLMNLDYDTRAAKARGESAGRIQTEQYTKTLAAPGSSLAATAGGIDPHGAVRAQAAAIQAEFKAFDEHVSAEKALLSNSGVNATDLGKSGGVIAPGSLDAMVRDSSLSVEQRSAAASRLIATGADKNIHEMLDYLGTTTDAGASTIMKQVGGDIGARKPKSLGQADVSALTTGTYSGDFDTKVKGRIHGGKQSGESLASASADELNRIDDVLSKIPKPAAGTDEAANRAALATSIDEYYNSVITSGRQVPNEVKIKMDSIKSKL